MQKWCPSILNSNFYNSFLTNPIFLKKRSNFQGSDRLGKVCELLIKQRSFYPLCPPHSSANIDFPHLNQFQFPYTPDILIVPSDLTYFVKVKRNFILLYFLIMYF